MWCDVYPTVHRLAGTPYTERLRMRAALLFSGREATLARRTAGTIFDLDGIGKTQPEVLVPYERHRHAEGLTVIRSKLISPTDRVSRSGFRVTSPTRTLIDLAAVLDDVALEAAIESARRKRLTSLQALQARADELGGTGRTGSSRIASILSELDDRAAVESPLEAKVARLLRSSGLPRPELQHEVAAGGKRFRLDFAWVRWLVALECDGEAFHDFRRDRARWTALAAAGWRILFATWSDVTKRPDVLLTRLEAALSASMTRT